MTLSCPRQGPTRPVVTVMSLVLLALLAVGGVALGPAAAAAGGKVVICHRTNDATNPYNQIAVSQSAALAAHADHEGPVFRPGLERWGDIIPPIRPGLPGGRNWPAGRDVLDNGCEVPPDVGPLPTATIGAVECVGPDGEIDITVRNGADATAGARFVVRIDGQVVARVGPVPPGGQETVIADLSGYEDQTVTVTVSSGGEVIASRAVTVDCEAPPPDPAVVIDAEITCAGQVATGSTTVTNLGPQPVTLALEIGGQPVGQPVTVPSGETQTATVDLSAYEDQEIVVELFVDGDSAASYSITPNCIPPAPEPEVDVSGQVCSPALATVTLSNTGDPDSSIVYAARVDGRIVQRSAPLYGGDTTTIVVDLSAYEDQTVRVALLANGDVLGSRTVNVDCEQPVVLPDQAEQDQNGGLPDVGATTGPGVLAAGFGLVLIGVLLVFAGRRGAGSGA